MQPRLRLDIGWSDLFAALSPLRTNVTAMEQAIAACVPPGCHVVTALSVRTLFDAILAETGTTPVVMSAVTIEDMARLIHAHGRPLRIVDINVDTLSPHPEAVRHACDESGAGIVLIAHLYGSRANVEGVANVWRDPGRLIVEDCAQAYSGALGLSPGADVALYSFGPIKVATALGGAIGLFRDGNLAARIRQRIATYPTLPDSWFLRRVVKYMALKVLNIAPIYRALVLVLGTAGMDIDKTIGKLARGFPSGTQITDIIRHRPPHRLLRLLARRLTSWKPGPDATPQLLRRLVNSVCVPGLKANPPYWWLAPVLVPHPDAMVAALRRAGFDATRGATSMRRIHDRDGHPAPEAERLINSIVYLPKPTNPAMADRLARCVELTLQTGPAAPVDANHKSELIQTSR